MTTMQRWELSAFGRENLPLVSVPRPVPGADEVLVEVEAVSLNFRGNSSELRLTGCVGSRSST
jgi:hypothetical protein